LKTYLLIIKLFGISGKTFYIRTFNYFILRDGLSTKYRIAPNGMKMTIKSINKLSFPWNLLFRISIIAMIGSNNTKINTKGIIKNKLKIPILQTIY